MSPHPCTAPACAQHDPRPHCSQRPPEPIPADAQEGPPRTEAQTAPTTPAAIAETNRHVSRSTGQGDPSADRDTRRPKGRDNLVSEPPAREKEPQIVSGADKSETAPSTFQGQVAIGIEVSRRLVNDWALPLPERPSRD